MKFVKALLAVVYVTALLVSCTSKPELDPPNIVWIVSEDNSKHYMELFDKHGVATPNIESLAAHGVSFDYAFSNAAVCSAARSTLISGCYGPRMGSHYHRNIEPVSFPEGLEMFPAYLKAAGYHTSNNAKEDYNFLKSDTVWDMSSKKATWRDRAEGQPFFHVFNTATTHESRLHFSQETYENHKTKVNPETCFVQPNHPDSKLFKYTNAYYRDKIVQMDGEVGAVLAKLKADSLMENTFIFYYGDHGGVLPGSKGYILETGVHVPLVVYVPEKYKHLVKEDIGTHSKRFVSFVDFGATVLNLAGVEVPELMDGKPFLGENSVEDNDITYSYADRFDEKYDMVRAVRKGKYKYMRNFQPFNFDGLMNNYRYKQLAYQEWRQKFDKGELNELQSAFYLGKAPEALYDVEADPFETKNLANDSALETTLNEMRAELKSWLNGMPDLSFYPEHVLIKSAFNDPVAFGKKHKAALEKYQTIADLQLNDFDQVKAEIDQLLSSDDAWERYWAVIVCSSFGDEAKSLLPKIVMVSKNDSEMINRVRALEYLALVDAQNPVKEMTECLYAVKDANEGLLILNTMALMNDCDKHFKFSFDETKLSEDLKNHEHAMRRIAYLNQASQKN